MDAINLLGTNRLFSSLSKDEITALVSKAARITIPVGESLSDRSGLGFLLCGRAGVYRGETQNVVLNRVYAPAVYGMAQLFGDDRTGTVILAETDCDLMLFNENDIKSLISSNSVFAVAYISLLSDKIRFLTKRICDFSSNSVENKLISFLSSGENASNMTELSKRLGIGRASLYRAINNLETNGLIEKSGKSISLISKAEE